MSNEKSDEELMTAYQLGDEVAFHELYKRHSGRVLGFLRQKTSDETKARDVFQATFLKLHRSRSRYNSSLPFVPWLFTICRSELIDALRKDARSSEEFRAALPDVVAPADESKDIDLSSLTEAQRQALELRYQQGSSFEQIARALGTSPVNARQIVSRAVKSLRGFYGKD